MIHMLSSDVKSVSSEYYISNKTIAHIYMHHFFFKKRKTNVKLYRCGLRT